MLTHRLDPVSRSETERAHFRHRDARVGIDCDARRERARRTKGHSGSGLNSLVRAHRRRETTPKEVGRREGGAPQKRRSPLTPVHASLRGRRSIQPNVSTTPNALRIDVRRSGQPASISIGVGKEQAEWSREAGEPKRTGVSEAVRIGERRSSAASPGRFRRSSDGDDPGPPDLPAVASSVRSR